MRDIRQVSNPPSGPFTARRPRPLSALTRP